MSTAQSPRKQRRLEVAEQRKQEQHDERVAGIANRILSIFAKCTPEETRELLKLRPENLTVTLAQRGALSEWTRVDWRQSNRRGQKIIRLEKDEQALIIEALRDESVVKLLAELLRQSQRSQLPATPAQSDTRFTLHKYEQLAATHA